MRRFFVLIAWLVDCLAGKKLTAYLFRKEVDNKSRDDVCKIVSESFWLENEEVTSKRCFLLEVAIADAEGANGEMRLTLLCMNKCDRVEFRPIFVKRVQASCDRRLPVPDEDKTQLPTD